MSEHVDFGELRSVLDGVRTPEQFERLIALMDAGVERVGRGVVEEQWLPYASQKLDQWPARVRRCRRELLRRLEQEGDVCWGRLVKTLDYEYSTLSARRVEELGEAKHLQNITHLDLSNTSVSWTDLNRLAQIAPFELESFSLRKSTSSGAKDSDIIPLFESPMLSKIKEISFPDWSRFGAASVKTMLERLPLGGLERLDVHGTGIGTSGLVKVLSCQGFTSLKALDVSGLDFTSKKVSRAFQEAEGLRGVRALNVSHTGISLSTMRAASALPCWTGLEELDLSGNELGMEDVSWLCDVEEYPALRRLTLLAKGLDEEALERLFMASCFERVEALSLREASLTERSVSGEHGWGSLRELDLSCASLDGECWRALSRCTFWGG